MHERKHYLASILAVLAIVATLFSAIPASAATQLVGDSSVESFDDYANTGQAEAFKYVASSTGVGITQYVYITDLGGLASVPAHVKLGVYSNNGSNQPGTLLATCTITSPTANAWNSCSLAGQALVITTSNTYWLAIMSPYLDYAVNFRDTDTGHTSGTTSYTTTGQTHTTLPSTFDVGSGYDNTPASMYVETI